jgi:hypothetical protein
MCIHAGEFIFCLLSDLIPNFEIIPTTLKWFSNWFKKGLEITEKKRKEEAAPWKPGRSPACPAPFPLSPRLGPQPTRLTQRSPPLLFQTLTDRAHLAAPSPFFFLGVAKPDSVREQNPGWFGISCPKHAPNRYKTRSLSLRLLLSPSVEVERPSSIPWPPLGSHRRSSEAAVALVDLRCPSTDFGSVKSFASPLRSRRSVDFALCRTSVFPNGCCTLQELIQPPSRDVRHLQALPDPKEALGEFAWVPASFPCLRFHF